MQVHDEVMPRMSDIYALQKQLNAELEKLQEMSAGDSTTKIQIMRLKGSLKAADDGMMQWMRDFSRQMAPPGDADSYQAFLDQQGMTHKAYLDFLKKEEKKIREVKVNMLNSIADAREFLEK